MCNCILCHVNRVAYKPVKSDLAGFGTVLKAIEEYDTNLSPYPFTQKDKQSMIDYLHLHAPSGVVHFEQLEEYFIERQGS